MDYEVVRERIRALYPDDQFKALRAALYRVPDLLKSDPSDEQIHEQARIILGQPKPEPPAPEVAEENPILAGELLTPEAEAKLAHQNALDLASKAVPVIVKTAEDYQKASLGFAAIKQMLADNEAKRVKLKAPILEAGRVLDAEFRAAEKTLQQELQRYELPMAAFKTAEREALREQEATKARLLREAEMEAQRKVDEAAARLQATANAVAEADPLMAAFLADDIEEAKDEVRAARLELNTVPDRVVVPDAVAPVTAIGSKTTFPLVWEITDPNLVPRNLCSPDSVKLNALMKVLRKDFPDITKLEPGAYPGITITEQTRIGGR